MAEGFTTKKIKVSSHLEERYGLYRILLAWTDGIGNRQRKSVSTGLAVKGNKGRAEEMMSNIRREHENKLRSKPSIENLLFADFMEKWLEVIKPEIKLTTYGGYQMNVQTAIAPFRLLSVSALPTLLLHLFAVCVLHNRNQGFPSCGNHDSTPVLSTAYQERSTCAFSRLFCAFPCMRFPVWRALRQMSAFLSQMLLNISSQAILPFFFHFP